MDRGWSQKQLIRTLVTSATYRQSSVITPELQERDPKNRVYRMGQESPDDEIRRKIGKHPLGRILEEKGGDDRHAAPVLNLHWDGTGARAS